jgi:hypothetical protein
VVFALAAGCTSNEPEATRPQPSSSFTASPAAGGQVLAVITSQGALTLYVVGPSPAARRLRVLPGPPGAKAQRVTLSGGAAPRVCATWGGERSTTLRCYDRGSTRWQDVPTGDGELSGAVGLSVSGRALAWAVDDPRDASKILAVQRTPGGAVSRIPAYPEPDPEEAALGVGDIAWSGDDTVLVQHGWDSDVNGSIAQVDLDAPPRGWTNAPGVARSQEWAVITGAPSSTQGGTVLATLEGWTDDGEKWQAVELRLGTRGGIASVVSVAAKGRRMRDVSGGPLGVVYRTESDTDVRTYWRAPGQSRGARVTGLPADAVAVVAQP